MNQKFMMPPKKDKDELDALGSLHYTKIIIVAAGVIAFFAFDSMFARIIIVALALYFLIRLTASKPNTQTAEPSTAPREPAPYARPATQSNQEGLLKIPQNLLGVSIAYQYTGVNVAGARIRVEDFQSIRPGTQIDFLPEPTNPHDSKAIQIWSDNQWLGFVHRGTLQDMLHDFLKQGNPVFAMVDAVLPDEKRVTYALGFYREPRPKYRGEALGIGRLTASASAAAQDYISLCEEGDEVSVDYDSDKDRYEVFSMDYIGSLPKKLEEYAESATFVIDEIGETDSGKMYVVVAAYE